ncbi:MAG: hypothetical protein RIM68_04425, partial [Arenibacter sp.]
MKKTKIMVQATISEGIAKVWDYYTNPEHIINWNFASDDWHCPYASNDMRVGVVIPHLSYSLRNSRLDHYF